VKGAAALFPDEVVTQAQVPTWSCRARAAIALITLATADHTKHTTIARSRWATWTRPSTRWRRRPRTRDQRVGIHRQALSSRRADLKGVELLHHAQDALAIGKGGHDVSSGLSTLAVPTFAY